MEKSVVFITGGASGIGAATVEEFLREGWQVVIADMDINTVTKDIRNNDDVRMVRMDLCHQEDVAKAVDYAIREFGHIDALVNNAGIQKWSTVEDMNIGVWNAVIDTNFYGGLYCLHSVTQHMLERSSGTIVNVTSIMSERGAQKRGPYAASKAAMTSLTRTAAVELGGRGIRVNAVGPGYVATPLMEEYFASGEIDEEELVSVIPMRRMAKPQEIATAIYFLASEKSSYVNGQTLFVDGGWLVD